MTEDQPKPKRIRKKKPKAVAALDPALIVGSDFDVKFQFKAKDKAYVRGWAEGRSVVITQRLLHLATFGDRRIDVPHYLAVDNDGKEWRLPQLQLAKRPI